MKLVIEHVNKTYAGGVRALRDVSLTVSTGLFGLLGPNGAGKSTLMRILATLQEADDGTIRLDDIDVRREKERVRAVLGYLPQTFGVLPDISAGDMLEHIARLKGITARGERREAVERLLRQTNLHEVRHRRLGTFSGGMRQRFGIAQALLGSPRLIVVDEPTAGLDPEERNRFHNLLGEIGDRIIVILSTHIVDDVSRLCREAAIIQGGRILYSGAVADALAALRGKIWRKAVDRRELADYETRYHIARRHLSGGRLLLHVHGDTPPPGFEAAEPELEDFYFARTAEGAGAA